MHLRSALYTRAQATSLCSGVLAAALLCAVASAEAQHPAPEPAAEPGEATPAETAPTPEATQPEATPFEATPAEVAPLDATQPEATPGEAPPEATPVEVVPEEDHADPVVQVVVRAPPKSGVTRAANAATAVDLRRARRESADLGAVLSRVEGVNVQRQGGLGSPARFSLGGFDERQVRFFVDGVPLEYAGYPFGLQNVPVNFIERVDVYKGVVPVRLGADALGGAVELVTDRSTRGTHAAASYEGGSFGTHRLSGGARHHDEASGFFAKAEAFVDRADNDYPVDVGVADRTGVITETKVYRFHDAYAAGGGNQGYRTKS